MQIGRRWLPQLTLLLLAVGFLALAVIVGTTYWLGERAQNYFDEVIEARNARTAAVDLRDAVQTAESSQRGFIVTGNEIYLAPYTTAKTVAMRQLDEVKRILAPYPDAKAPVDRLVEVLSGKFGEMDQTIELKRARKDDEALAIIRTNRGKALMDEANVFFSGLITAADDRLTTGVSEQRSNANLLRIVTIIGGFVIVAVVAIAAIAALRYTRELRNAQEEVVALNAGLEERVRARTADLAQANDEIQRFAYIVTHDLRAPLVNIMGFTSELESSVGTLRALVDKADAEGRGNDPAVQAARLATTDDLPEAIRFIRSSTKKMDSLINAILKLSREGRREPRPEEVELKEVVETSVSALQHQIEQADGIVTVEVDVPTMLGDRLSLEQVIGNLLDNAVKYRAKDRPLRIDVRAAVAPNDRISIEIADNGRGIADQDRERVFELFRRSGPQDQTGDGIGLAFVRAVVRTLGGEVTVSSALDVGTTFRVVVPRNLSTVES